MARRWTLHAHSRFFRALRVIASQGGDVYALSQAIWAALEETDDPTAGATPVVEVPGRYEREFLGRLVTYEVREHENMIRLLLVV